MAENNAPGRDQCRQHIQALATLGRDEVNLPFFGPCASIRLRVCEASFIYVGQFDFAKL
jgi:hypothetical protein